jgi:uncharacterized protein
VSLGLPAAATTELADCPPVQGITCQGWVTDDAGVLGDRADLEEAAGRLVASTGSQIAVVITQSSGNMSPRELAEDIGNTWGVGDAERNDGIVVLVALDERRTEIVTGPGAALADDEADFAAGLADSFFGAGDYDGGISAILGGIQQFIGDGQEPGEPEPFPRRRRTRRRGSGRHHRHPGRPGSRRDGSGRRDGRGTA